MQLLGTVGVCCGTPAYCLAVGVVAVAVTKGVDGEGGGLWEEDEGKGYSVVHPWVGVEGEGRGRGDYEGSPLET